MQLREGGRHPFGVLDGYVPLSQGEMELYRSIREAVPIVDAALRKLVRLAGGVKVSCRESAAQEGLDWFLQHVNTGRGEGSGACGDEVEEARAELYREQAEELRLAREGKEG